MINDFEYCPRLPWMQYKPSLKLFAKNAAHQARGSRPGATIILKNCGFTHTTCLLKRN